MRGVLPWLVRWARRSGIIELCPALAVLFSPVQNIFFLTAHSFTILLVRVQCTYCKPGPQNNRILERNRSPFPQNISMKIRRCYS
jgi:hypothetical protein